MELELSRGGKPRQELPNISRISFGDGVMQQCTAAVLPAQ